MGTYRKGALALRAVRGVSIQPRSAVVFEQEKIEAARHRNREVSSKAAARKNNQAGN